MAFQSMEEIMQQCKNKQISFAEAIIQDDCQDRNVTSEETRARMYQIWDAMLLASATYEKNLHSKSGLVGGDGGKMEKYCMEQESLCGSFMGSVITQALQMGESNACMKRIVAAPTAGSCGVLPAVLIPYFKSSGCSIDLILDALFVSAGIGQVIAERAFISGAAGGCQAEVGSASAMAAGAMVAVKGGSPDQISHAAAIALKNMLGLVCDPVAGLVEVPCVKRNVAGAVNAMASADMALAGIKSAIPADQVIDAMREVGEKMDVSLRETGRGGLANTPIGQKEAKHIRSLEVH